jgi:hypothetical protein
MIRYLFSLFNVGNNDIKGISAAFVIFSASYRAIIMQKRNFVGQKVLGHEDIGNSLRYYFPIMNRMSALAQTLPFL